LFDSLDTSAQAGSSERPAISTGVPAFRSGLSPGCMPPQVFPLQRLPAHTLSVSTLATPYRFFAIMPNLEGFHP
jgi:hypothetical protein